MTREQHAALRRRFHFACAYCGTSETGVGALLTVDHFQPLSRGGLDDESNWVYCCAACNSFKSAFWNPSPDERLLHPLQDNFLEHLDEQNGVLIALSARGERHIEILHLNREQLIAQRQHLAALDELRERLRSAEARLRREQEIQGEFNQ